MLLASLAFAMSTDTSAFSVHLAPFNLRGELAVNAWAPSRLPDADDDTLARVRAMYAATDPVLAQRLEDALGARELVGDTNEPQRMAAGGRGAQQVGPLVTAAARFLASEAGPRIAVIDVGGWDTHANQGGAQGALAARIRTDFGDEAGFAAAFKAAANGHFGSGWAWLVLDGGALRIVTTANADTPIVHGHAPLLVIDVWEHAYYLDRQERRAAYVAGVVENLLNWEFAGRNFELAVERTLHPAVAQPAAH